MVTPVPKNGSSDLVGNYSPISVLPVVVKVLERVVHRQLYTYLQENNLEKRREQMRMAMVHICVTVQAPINISKCLKMNAQIGNTRTRGKFNLILPKGKLSFIINHLPSEQARNGKGFLEN